MKCYFASWPQALEQQQGLENTGAVNRLFSFHYCRGMREGLIQDIIKTGLADYIAEPDEPIDEIPLDVKIMCGSWVNKSKVK